MWYEEDVQGLGKDEQLVVCGELMTSTSSPCHQTCMRTLRAEHGAEARGRRVLISHFTRDIRVEYFLFPDVSDDTILDHEDPDNPIKDAMFMHPKLSTVRTTLMFRP